MSMPFFDHQRIAVYTDKPVEFENPKSRNMGSGRKKWRIFHKSPTDSKPPKEFICSICGSLMADPVVVSSGETFERNCVLACKSLRFSPTMESSDSRPDFSSMISNTAFKSTILKWCDTNRVERPKPIEYDKAEKLVSALMASTEPVKPAKVEVSVSEEELLKAVADNPPVKFSHAATDLNRRTNHFYSSSSSEESVTTTIPIPATPTTPKTPKTPKTPLPLTTRPSCYSSSSSSEIVAEDETLNPEEEDIIVKLKSCQVFEQEEAVIALRKITKTKVEIRVPICTPRLLSAVRSVVLSRYSVIQVNAVAALVNLSLEKVNKVKIVRSGVVPLLIDVLKGGFPEAQEHAAGAIFSLALDDDNKTAIGVLGALPALLHLLRSESERARQDSALALYHLSLVQSNRSKLVKLGSVPVLLSMVKGGDLGSRALLILCNLAACNEGRDLMLDANAVECFVGMLRERGAGSEAVKENCVAALYSLSLGSLRFRSVAKEAGAFEVLVAVAERGSARAKEKAEKMLEMMRGRTENASNSEQDWESILNSGVISRARYQLQAEGVASPGLQSISARDRLGANMGSAQGHTGLG